MRPLPAFALAALVLLLVAGAGALFPPGPWYDELAKPSFTPPDEVFGPAWAVFYTLNAIALGFVLKAPRGAARRDALQAMGVQLALNALWTPVFFGAEAPFGGLVVITALLAAIFHAIGCARRVSGVAAVLLLPYAAWVAFAFVLNLSIWMLNR
jgi:tryptophan-rich sensory protein